MGITGLRQLTQHRAVDLLSLHGMGPKAIVILREAPADEGLSLRDDTPRIGTC
jgi:hypothetical protein